MPDYSDYETVKSLLKEAQDVEEDNRDLVKEAHLFVTKPDGQWEPEWYEKTKGKPRYTFDQTSPIIDQVSGQIERSEFGINIDPASGDASKEIATLYSGMVRNIENISEAQSTYAAAGRNIVTGGFDVWHLKTGELSDSSFDQDIMIDRIYNSWDRVWFDTGSLRQDKADANYGFLLSAVPRREFDERWPDRSGSSVSDGSRYEAYYQKEDVVLIGHVYYVKLVERELVQTNLGRVFWRDEIEPVEDELAAKGETITKSRKVKDRVFMLRKFDGEGWLDDEQETVWNRVPLIPVYGNYKVIENKIVYHGWVQKAMDPQRILNYSLSREIEEGALAPRSKYWMTKKQAQGHDKQLRTLNTNADPVQFYNHVEGEPAPAQQGGAQINPGLRVISDGMFDMLRSTAGLFDAGLGDNPNAQSGVAIERLQQKGNNVTSKYFRSLEIAICATAKAIVDAIPKVYDAQRQVRIIGADGSVEMVAINQEVIDNQTQKPVITNDLSVGKYDVTCEAGPSFNSRQSESVAAILELAAIKPEILDLGTDVLLNNISAPGVDKIADRSRRQLFSAGVIPVEQMTDEEKAEAAAAANAPQQPDAATLLAQAENIKAQADLQRNQVQAYAQQVKAQLDAQRLQIEAQKLALDGRMQEIKLLEMQQKQGLAVDKQRFDQLIEAARLEQDRINDAVNNLNTQADTLKKIFDATGADAVMSPAAAAAYGMQATNVAEGASRA